MTSASDYFNSSRLPTDCKLISKEGKQNYTHNVLLAARSEVLRDIFTGVTEQSETVIILPDYSFRDVKTFLEETLDAESTVNSNLGQLFLSKKTDVAVCEDKFNAANEGTYNVKEEENDKNIFVKNYNIAAASNLKEKEENENLADSLNLNDNACSDNLKNNDEFNVNNKTDEIFAYERIKIRNNKSETIRKKKLYQRAIDSFLSGESPSLYAVNKKYGLNYSTLYKIFTVRGTYQSKGRKSKVFTEEEEKDITQKVLASSRNGKYLTWDMLSDMLVKEAETIMVANPDRNIMRVSSTSGTIMNKSFVRRFAQRNGLSEYLLKKFTLTDRPFQCEECDMGYTFKNILVKHMKTKHIKNNA